VAVAYSPKGQLLVSGGYSGKERDGELMAWLWDATTGERKNSLKLYDAGIKRARFEEAIAVAFSPDGKLAATGNKDVLKVWDVATGTVVWQARTAIPENEWHCAMADALAFSPDGKTLAGAAVMAPCDYGVCATSSPWNRHRVPHPLCAPHQPSPRIVDVSAEDL
jgi:WD40 repeat protein